MELCILTVLGVNLCRIIAAGIGFLTGFFVVISVGMLVLAIKTWWRGRK